MLTRDEIDDVITGLLESIPLTHCFPKAIRKLDTAQFNLGRSTDESGLLARKAINQGAHVRRLLVDYTGLREEEEFTIAIELATEYVIQADYEEATNQEGFPNDSD